MDYSKTSSEGQSGKDFEFCGKLHENKEKWIFRKIGHVYVLKYPNSIK